MTDENFNQAENPDGVQHAPEAHEEAQAEVNGEPEAVLRDEPVTVDDLPSREDDNVHVRPSEHVDPNEGWTNQHVVREDDEARTYVTPNYEPGQYVHPSQLPTKEGLAEIGVVDVESYLAGVPVRK